MRKLSGLLLVAALALVACGGGSSNKSNASASKPTTAPAATSGGLTFTDFCGAKAGFAAVAPPTSSAQGDLKTILQNAHASIARAVQYSPVEIRADVRTLADGFNAYYDVMAKADFNFQKLASDPSAMQTLQKLDDPSFKAAADRINAWVEAHCK